MLARKCAEISSAPGLLAYSAGLSSAQPGRGEPTQRRCGACYARSVRAWMRSSIASSATSSGRVSRWTWARSRPPCRAASVARARSPGSAPAGQVTAGVHGPEPVADPGLPAAEPPGHGHAAPRRRSRPPRRPGCRSGSRRGTRASAGARPAGHARPAGRQRVEVVQMRALGVQDRVRLVVDDRADQRLLVLEVVVHLRAAHPGRRPDVLQRRLGHAALEDELRRGRHDPLPGLAPPAGQPSFGHAHELSTNWIGQPSFGLPLWVVQPS